MDIRFVIVSKTPSYSTDQNWIKTSSQFLFEICFFGAVGRKLRSMDFSGNKKVDKDGFLVVIVTMFSRIQIISAQCQIREVKTRPGNSGPSDIFSITIF